MNMINKEILLAAFLVILLVLVPACAGDSDENVNKEADGLWCYMPDLSLMQPVIFYESYDPEPSGPITDYGQPGKGFATVPYGSKWTGTFSGESQEYGVLIAHEDGPKVFLDAIVFDSVEVNGVTGGLYMNAYGELAEDGMTWVGNWEITGGTGDLEDLKGHGTFWGPGWLGDPEQCGEIDYAVDELEGI